MSAVRRRGIPEMRDSRRFIPGSRKKGFYSPYEDSPPLVRSAENLRNAACAEGRLPADYGFGRACAESVLRPDDARTLFGGSGGGRDAFRSDQFHHLVFLYRNGRVCELVCGAVYGRRAAQPGGGLHLAGGADRANRRAVHGVRIFLGRMADDSVRAYRCGASAGNRVFQAAFAVRVGPAADRCVRRILERKGADVDDYDCQLRHGRKQHPVQLCVHLWKLGRAGAGYPRGGVWYDSLRTDRAGGVFVPDFPEGESRGVWNMAAQGGVRALQKNSPIRGAEWRAAPAGAVVV